MNEIRILGIHVRKEADEIERLQEVLSSYGCSIRTRIGLHNCNGEYSPETKGVILLELVGNPDEMENMENRLKQIAHIDVKRMTFN